MSFTAVRTTWLPSTLLVNTALFSYLKTVFHERLRVEEPMKKHLSGRHGNLKRNVIKENLINRPVLLKKKRPPFCFCLADGHRS